MKLALLAGMLALLLADSSAQTPPAENQELFVAVGHGGRRVTSRDGSIWESDRRRSVGPTDSEDLLSDIAFGSGRFIAVGGGAKIGRILSTRDGREWRSLREVNGRVATVAFGNGRFVAGHGAELMFSTDGETFQSGPRLDWKGSVFPRRAAAGDTEAGFRFLLIGEIDLHPDGRRLHWRGGTADGTRWDHTALDTPLARDVAYGAGHFVVVGPDGLLESSHDGQTWRRHVTAAGEDFTRVIWTGARFVVSGGITIWSSPDGLAWTKETARIPSHIAWAREGSVALAFSQDGALHVSRDFAHWKKASIPPGPPLQAIAVGRVDASP